MLGMVEWCYTQLMEAEVSGLAGAEKNAHSLSRSDYRCGYRPRGWTRGWERCTSWCFHTGGSKEKSLKIKYTRILIIIDTP